MARSRRDVLRLGGASVAAAVTGGLAGCSSITDSLSGGDGNGGGSSNPLSMVPQGVSAVARGNVTKTLNDSAVTTFVNRILSLLAQQENYSGPTDKSELLDRFSQEAGIELGGAKTAVGFLKYPEPNSPGAPQYSGLWFEADWSESEVIGALEKSYAFTEGSYNGHAIYEPGREYQRTWAGVVGSNAYVIGRESAVKETIDVAEGDLESLGGDLRSAYGKSRSAPFRFAASVPEERVPTASRQVGGSSIDLQQFAAVDHVTGATYHEGDTVGVQVKLLTGGSSDAEDVRNMLAGGISAAEGQVQNERLRKALDDVSVTRNGSTVVAEVSGSVDRAARVIETVYRRYFLT